MTIELGWKGGEGRMGWQDDIVRGSPPGRGPTPDMVSIDPGGAHCGVALFCGTEGLASGDDSWVCTTTWEMPPAACILFVRELIHHWVEDPGTRRELLVETFRLYGKEAMSLVGSEMETCQVIGVLKYLHAWYGHPSIQLIQQPADIQDPTTGILKGRRVKSTAKRTNAGPHALSAELHGWYRLLKGRH